MPFRVGTNRIGRLVVGTSAPVYDTDAQAFFTAVEGGGDTLTTTEKDATNQFVLDLKSAAIWSKMNVIYPFVGGTATSTKWNLSDPQDTDAAFRITWQNPSNGVFSANGVQGDNATFAGNTHYNPFVQWNGAARHISVYCNQSTNTSGYDMGANQAGVGNNNVLIVEFSNNTSYVGFGGFVTATNTPGDGNVIGTYDSTLSPRVVQYLNGSNVATATTTPTDYNRPIAIFADNRGTGVNDFNPFSASYTNRRNATYTIGDHLDATEASDLYDALTTFNTSLSRQA